MIVLELVNLITKQGVLHQKLPFLLIPLLQGHLGRIQLILQLTNHIMATPLIFVTLLVEEELVYKSTAIHTFSALRTRGRLVQPFFEARIVESVAAFHGRYISGAIEELSANESRSSHDPSDSYCWLQNLSTCAQVSFIQPLSVKVPFNA